MKDTAEIGIGEWSDTSLEVDGLLHHNVLLNENTSVFVRRTTIMGRGRGQDVNDPYRTCKDFLNQQAHRRMENSKDDSISKALSERDDSHSQGQQC